jgi:serine/threonine protein kinase
MLAPETVLQSRYRIIRLLGQGGMGAVYEALDERLDTTVALKETLFSDERLRKQFEREARLLARMHHPALPRVSDHFAEGDGQFLVMQFIPGDDLSQMITRKQGPFPPDQVLTWGDQLLDALDYLHTQDPQIIHRDIKPQNLKLTSRGQIILLDFGLAKGQAGGISIVTTSASIYGYTPNYAPLEQIQGQGTDARSDIYALSATLYHLMTGVKPPDALTRAAALVNGQPDPLVPANQIAAGVGPEVAGVLGRAMSQNRDQRYPTAAGMRAALNGTGEAATLVGKTEAATVLFEQPANTLGAGVAATEAQTALKHGETTVVRSPNTATGQRRVAPWAIGGAAFVLVVVLCCAFYAYQHRNGATATANPSDPVNVNSVTGQPSRGDQAANGPTSGPLADEKKGAVATHPEATPEPAKKNEKTAKNNEKTDKSANKDGNPPSPDDSEELNVKPPDAPADSELFIPNPARPPGRNGARQMGVPTTRYLRDGTKIMTLGDGTRVVTAPDGTTHVLRPGAKIPRRRAQP